MGANGDAGYLTSSSAPDFLVDTDDGSDTAAPICDTPRASAPSTSSRWLKAILAESNADDLPFDQAVKLGAFRARRQSLLHQIACGRTGHFDS